MLLAIEGKLFPIRNTEYSKKPHLCLFHLTRLLREIHKIKLHLSTEVGVSDI